MLGQRHPLPCQQVVCLSERLSMKQTLDELAATQLSLEAALRCFLQSSLLGNFRFTPFFHTQRSSSLCLIPCYPPSPRNMFIISYNPSSPACTSSDLSFKRSYCSIRSHYRKLVL